MLRNYKLLQCRSSCPTSRLIISLVKFVRVCLGLHNKSTPLYTQGPNQLEIKLKFKKVKNVRPNITCIMDKADMVQLYKYDLFFGKRGL